MNENQIIVPNNRTHEILTDTVKNTISKLSGKESLIGLGIIGAVVLGTTCVVCLTGNELIVGRGIIAIKQPEHKVA